MSQVGCLLVLLGLVVMVVSSLGQPPQADPNIDQILDDLRILTRQQLDSLNNVTTTTPRPSETTTSARPATSVKLKLASAPSSSQKSFQLPPKYDPNRIPRTSRSRPLLVRVNMTVLHVSLDRQENVVQLDLEMREHWRDKRLRLRKVEKKDDDDDELMAATEEDDEGDTASRLESHLLEPQWAARLWHPISRLQNNAEVIVPFLVGSGDTKKKMAIGGEDNRQKTIEQEYFIENILVLRNETSAYVYMTMKMRLAVPMYECKRDDTSLFPFDRIRCTFLIANVVYDRKQLQYDWDAIRWEHNGYHRGEFYLRQLDRSIENRLLVDLDKDNEEHSTLRVEVYLNRQIGDYILNVYLLHIFLLALCLATFWISISNILIRLALSIIVLIIIKFQTIQTLKDDRGHLVSALSIWTFGLSVLVILCLFLHILSYYSMQHKWNDKILTNLVVDKTPTTPTGSSTMVGMEMETPSAESAKKKDFRKRLRDRWERAKRAVLLWLNSMILKNAKGDGYDRINLVDMLSRTCLLVLYILFVLIYFLRYAF